MDEYVDVFVQAVPWHMRMVWAGGLDYPGLYPSAAYRKWSDEHANHVQHYYAAYPDATTTEVAAALKVDDRFERFLETHGDVSDEEFDRGYRSLLTDVRRWL
jgi:hypothetical protein